MKTKKQLHIYFLICSITILFTIEATAQILPPPAGYTVSQKIFEDQFLSTVVDASKWIPQIADQNGIWRKTVPVPYSGSDAGQYDAEYFDPYPQQGTNVSGQHTVTDSCLCSTGGLHLIAKPSKKFTGYTWAAGCITTHGLFHIPASGGYAQFSAKMPDSRYGAWGGLWFLEGGAEIDLIESGYTSGSANANNIMAMNYHGTGGTQKLYNTGIDLSAAYHTYGMEYNPGVSIKMYLDGALVNSWSSPSSTLPTGAYTILIDLQMAQGASGWHTVSDSVNHPGPFELYVSDVQVYSLNATSVGQNSALQNLFSIFPNPANGETTLSYSLSESSDVKIILYDVLGKEIEKIAEGKQTAGTHQLNFNTASLQSGVYFIRGIMNGQERTEKLVVNKN